MLSNEVAFALASFFDRIGPSHEELTGLFRRHGLSSLDPRTSATENIGKMRRVRAVLLGALQGRPREGERLVQVLVDAVRAEGGFRSNDDNYAGDAKIKTLKAAFATIGYRLHDDGLLYPFQLEGLEGRRLTEALRAYVSRARVGGGDPAVVLGTSKSLVEAAARHVLQERTSQYPHSRTLSHNALSSLCGARIIHSREDCGGVHARRPPPSIPAGNLVAWYRRQSVSQC